MDALKILVVDDESRMRKLVKDFLTKKNFQVLEAGDGEEAMDIFYKEKDIALLILDVMMPKMDGWEVCREIRKNSKVPIIMLTAKSDDIDKLIGFEYGADDYVTKPFGVMELISRIKAVLRRSGPQAGSDIIEYKGIILDNQSRNVKVDGKDIAITFKEFELLKYLLKNKGTVVPREVLLEKIWGYHFEGESRTLDVHIGSLRHKLGEKGKCIETIRNVGYKI